MKKKKLTQEEVRYFLRKQKLIKLAIENEELLNISKEYDENFEKQYDAWMNGDYELHRQLSEKEKGLNSRREQKERELGIYMREDEENKYGLVFFEYDKSTLLQSRYKGAAS